MATSETSPFSSKERAHRPNTVHFAPTELRDALEPLAKMRCVGFKWGATDYASLSRSMSPSPEGVQAHAPALEIMIKFATSANPDESDRLCPLSQHEVREWARAKVKVSDS